MVGGYPGQVWMVGGTLGTTQPGLDGGGYPGYPHHDWMGNPNHDWMEYPPPWLDGVTPPPWLDGVPPPSWLDGYPLPWLDGVPPTHHDWMGYPPTTNIVSTCYAAGSMPLAFTQEDFLVFTNIHTSIRLIKYYSLHLSFKQNLFS